MCSVASETAMLHKLLLFVISGNRHISVMTVIFRSDWEHFFLFSPEIPSNPLKMHLMVYLLTWCSSTMTSVSGFFNKFLFKVGRPILWWLAAAGFAFIEDTTSVRVLYSWFIIEVDWHQNILFYCPIDSDRLLHVMWLGRYFFYLFHA